LSSFQEYTPTCEFLSLAWKQAVDDIEVVMDGFVKPTHDSDGFRTSQSAFSLTLLRKIQGNCEGNEKTQLGKFSRGEFLQDTFKSVETSTVAYVCAK
jgi:hypothetical protein